MTQTRSRCATGTWKAAVPNAFGKPTSYALEPGGVSVPYAAPDFPGLARAAFAQHQLWVTQYQEGELYAAGPFPNQGKTVAGLTEFVKDAAGLAKQDVVVWYTAGYTRVRRAPRLSGDARRDHRLSPGATRVLHAQSRPRRCRSEPARRARDASRNKRQSINTR